MTNNTTTDILNDILETLIDSTDGYEKSAELAERDSFKNFFARRAVSRRAMASAVRDEIIKLGDTPESDGTILASAHRAFMKLTTAVRDTDEAVIEAVDDGEEYLRNKFERALAHEELSTEIKAMLRNFQGELKADGRLIDHLEESTS